MQIDFLFSIVVLILSVVVHEVSHGYMANALGDPTARYAGRLTLNPVKHLDPIGSFILPLLTYLSGGFIFGWAKPVPYNPYNLKKGKWSEALVAGVGPLSNFAIALVFGLLIRYGVTAQIFPPSFYDIAGLIVLTNLGLGFFNLVPIPPLDGSKILFAFLPYEYIRFRQTLEANGFLLVVFFILFFSRFLSPLVFNSYELITGISLL